MKAASLFVLAGERVTGDQVEPVRRAGHGSYAQQQFEMAGRPQRVDSAIPERIFQSIQVGGYSTGGFGRFRVRTGEKQTVAGLTRVRDKSNNPICFAGASSLCRGDISRWFSLGRPLVTNNLLITGLIVLEDEIELLLEQGCPWIRSRTA